MLNFKPIFSAIILFSSFSAIGQVDVGYIRSKLPIYEVFQDDWIEAKINNSQFKIANVFHFGMGYDYYAENCDLKKGSISDFICTSQRKEWVSKIRYKIEANSKIIYLFDIEYVTCGAGDWDINKSLVIKKFGNPKISLPKSMRYESAHEYLWVDEGRSLASDFINHLNCPAKNHIILKITYNYNGEEFVRRAIHDWRYEKSAQNKMIF